MLGSDTISVLWVTRAGLIGVLFGIVGLSRLFLGDRQRYGAILESAPLAVLDVLSYNACCYLAVGLPPDPGAPGSGARR